MIKEKTEGNPAVFNLPEFGVFYENVFSGKMFVQRVATMTDSPLGGWEKKSHNDCARAKQTDNSSVSFNLSTFQSVFLLISS